MKAFRQTSAPAALLLSLVTAFGQPAPTQSTGEKATVAGTVLNAVTGAPIPRARVLMYQSGRRGGRGQGGPTQFSATTDASGAFLITGVGPGDYRLSAQKNRYARANYGERRPGGEGTRLKVSAGAAVTRIDFQLTPACVVTGRVLDEDGEPVAHAQVAAMRYRYLRGQRRLLPFSGMVSTNDLGEYRMFGIPPGKYYISATYRNRAGRAPFRGGGATSESDAIYPTQYYPGVIEPDQAAPLTLRAGQEQSGIDFQLESVRAARIRGKVVMATGGELPRSISVQLLPAGAGTTLVGIRRSRGVNRGTGEFEITGVLPGSYYLAATTRGGRDRLFGRLRIQVGREPITGLVLPLGPGLSLTGQVSIEDDTMATPLDNLRVEFVALELFAGAGRAETDEEGAFTVNGLAPGLYRLAVRGLPNGAYLKSVAAGNRELLDSGVDPATLAGAPIKVVISLHGSTLAGAVSESDGAPVAGGTVVLAPEESMRARTDLYRQTTTDDLGMFSLNGIPPGNYQVYAFDYIEPGAYQDPSFLDSYKNEATTVEVDEGAKPVIELRVITAAADT